MALGGGALLVAVPSAGSVEPCTRGKGSEAAGCTDVSAAVLFMGVLCESTCPRFRDGSMISRTRRFSSLVSASEVNIPVLLGEGWVVEKEREERERERERGNTRKAALGLAVPEQVLLYEGLIRARVGPRRSMVEMYSKDPAGGGL